ncbi:hypothetical protein [Streptomyces sp. NPDC058657]|uniref:WXG100 family type VII secretion target n=1 Tax=unclassified Streptomyces TaxID=2593676 RepID=UPI003658E99C
MTSRFESYDLNTMIDLVDAGNPQALETAGRALLGVRSAFHGAARELREHLAGVEWKGEAAAEFRKYGVRLVEHADALGEYAQRVAMELREAGGGLTSVRNSLPPRDGSAATGAVPSEAHRQEAINQLNRLASYYQVSTAKLAAEPEPVFEEDLTAAVPRPEGQEALGAGAGTPGTGPGPGSPGPGAGAHPGPGPLPGPEADAGSGPGTGLGSGPGTGLSSGLGAGPGEASAARPSPSHSGSDAPQSAPPGGGPSPAPVSTPTVPLAHAPTTMELNSVAPTPIGPSHPTPPSALHASQPLTAQATTAGPASGWASPLSAGIPMPPPLTSTPGAPGPVSAAGNAAQVRAAPITRPLLPTSVHGVPGAYGVSGGTPTRAASSRPGAFTQGGAGLIRPGAPPMASPLAPPPRSTPHPARNHHPTSSSPLTEDEETWTSVQPAAAPPVVTHVSPHPH